VEMVYQARDEALIRGEIIKKWLHQIIKICLHLYKRVLIIKEEVCRMFLKDVSLNWLHCNLPLPLPHKTGRGLNELAASRRCRLRLFISLFLNPKIGE